MTEPTSDRIELARRARVLALDDATPSAEQSAEWAIESGARTDRDAERDVRTIWRDDRGPFPRIVAKIHGRRTLTSPLTSAPADDGKGGYALLNGLTGDESGSSRAVSAPSGAARHIGRSEQGESLAHHETRARRSRKGRNTYDVLRHHARPRPVTSEPSGFDGMDSLALIRVADDILRRAGVSAVDVSGTYPDGSAPPYLLGTDGASSQWAQMVRKDRSALDQYNVAIHHAGLLTPFQHGRTTYGRNVVVVVHGRLGVVHAGAVRPSGSKRASWRPTIWHGAEYVHESHIGPPTVRPENKVEWNGRLRIRGSARKGERATFERLTSGQYVRAERRASLAPSMGYGALARFATGAATICHSWHADTRRETEVKAVRVYDADGRLTYIGRRARLAVGSAPSESAWHGFVLTARPAKASDGVKRSESGAERKRASDSARDTTPKGGPSMSDDEAERAIRAAIRAGTLTLVQRSQGRWSAELVRADGSRMTWRARSRRAVAARLPLAQ